MDRAGAAGANLLQEMFEGPAVRERVHRCNSQVQAAAGVRVLGLTKSLRWLVVGLSPIAALLLLAAPAHAQQTGRIFPYKWVSPPPVEDITTADVQHALIWTRHYGAMVDGGYGPYTKRAISGWLTSKGYGPGDTLTREQAVELVTDGLQQRDAYGWALLIDDAVGFSVGISTKMSHPEAPTWQDGVLTYGSNGDVGHTVAIFPQADGCAEMDRFYDAFSDPNVGPREVHYKARKDDWFVVAGEAGPRRFYRRTQCRPQGIVTVVTNVATPQVEALAFLFVAMTNSLSLRPSLNLRVKPAPRLEFPAVPPGVAASAAPSATASPRGQSLYDVDRGGKTTALKLALTDGKELRASEVFEKASEAVYIVKSQDRLGSAVAISERELLTNCHVVGSQQTVLLERDGRQMRATLQSANPDADRCVLMSGVVLPRWVKVRPYADVKVGERAFTIGAPQGLELSLGEGIISSKRSLDQTRLFQTSAPISQGSSGGGLFDAQGNLIGITTFFFKVGQSLNFAIAAEEYAK
jgi:S1-C subfamily serine protease